ncbi:MAG: FMN-binding negative transcriptional regulator [Steroidobacteraceae bacterium]
MYIPKHHEETHLPTLHSFIRAHALGTLTTLGDGELVINHIPFLLDASRGDRGTLIAHVARANTVWRVFSETVPSVIVFHGAESYITPTWYPSKDAHGKVVPTWNYAVVHAHGVPVVIHDKEWLLQHVNQLTDLHEADRARPWKVADAPADYIERMITGIVGIEIPISKLVGKWKVSQNRSEADRLGVVAGLVAHPGARSEEMAALVDATVSPGARDRDPSA